MVASSNPVSPQVTGLFFFFQIDSFSVCKSATAFYPCPFIVDTDSS